LIQRLRRARISWKAERTAREASGSACGLECRVPLSLERGGAIGGLPDPGVSRAGAAAAAAPAVSLQWGGPRRTSAEAAIPAGSGPLREAPLRAGSEVARMLAAVSARAVSCDGLHESAGVVFAARAPERRAENVPEGETG